MSQALNASGSLLPICGILMGIGGLLCPSTISVVMQLALPCDTGILPGKSRRSLTDNIAIPVRYRCWCSVMSDKTMALAAWQPGFLADDDNLLSIGVVTTIMPSMAEKKALCRALLENREPFLYRHFSWCDRPTCYNKFKIMKPL